jgi:4'-phosphopantetheinyl transferase
MPSALVTPWTLPESDLVIGEKAVHLWRFRLNKVPAASILAPFEKSRVERLRSPEKAQAFVVARTRLRRILSRYVGVEPQALKIQYGDHGKPFILESPIRFNLSHSGQWGVCLVSRNLDVGVDLERVNRELAYATLSQRFFSKKENLWLQAAPESRRRRNFFRLWTRKEAWLKGKGGGFSEPDLELACAHVSARSAFADNWWLVNLPVARGYVGAVAVAGEIERIEKYSLAVK